MIIIIIKNNNNNKINTVGSKLPIFYVYFTVF